MLPLQLLNYLHPESHQSDLTLEREVLIVAQLDQERQVEPEVSEAEWK